MSKILAVIKREYLQIVRTKGFIIGTVLGPVLMLMFIVVPVVMSVISVPQQERIGVIDKSGKIFTDLDKGLRHFTLQDGNRRYVLEEFKSHGGSTELRESLNQKVLSKELTAYVFIPEDIIKKGEAEFVSEHVSDFNKTINIQNALNNVIIQMRLNEENLDAERIGKLMTPVRISTKKVTKRGVEKETGGTFMVSYFMVLILYMTLIFYGQAVMRGVIEEKNSRVVEVVLSSLRPFQLMAGKIVGIAAVGLTQYAIWSVFGLIMATSGGSIVSGFFPQAEEFSMPSIPTYIFIYFILFFILGYFLYSTLFAAIGSMVNSEKEAQQLMMPVIMLLIIPLLLIIFVMRSPSSSLSVALSLIPFFSPMLMMLRISILLPPFIQILGSIVLLGLTILLMIWLSAKIYRVGILMYGKPPSLPEIVKWMRYK